MCNTASPMYRCCLKPTLDFLFALAAFLCLLPLLLVASVLLLFANRGDGIFFIQDRLGKGRKVIRVIKFKTMRDVCGSDGELLPDSERVTGIGKFVRTCSIDELPQLINILKGDMSLIGPRPLLAEYGPLYTEEQHRRHTIRPGITGWAQCNGRNSLTWEQRLGYDLWYVDNMSFAADVKIFFRTIGVLFRRNVVNHGENETIIPPPDTYKRS